MKLGDMPVCACPFCKTDGYEVVFRGKRTDAEIREAFEEQQRVLLAQAKMLAQDRAPPEEENGGARSGEGSGEGSVADARETLSVCSSDDASSSPSVPDLAQQYQAEFEEVFEAYDGALLSAALRSQLEETIAEATGAMAASQGQGASTSSGGGGVSHRISYSRSSSGGSSGSCIVVDLRAISLAGPGAGPSRRNQRQEGGLPGGAGPSDVPVGLATFLADYEAPTQEQEQASLPSLSAFPALSASASPGPSLSSSPSPAAGALGGGVSGALDLGALACEEARFGRTFRQGELQDIIDTLKVNQSVLESIGAPHQQPEQTQEGRGGNGGAGDGSRGGSGSGGGMNTCKEAGFSAAGFDLMNPFSSYS